MIRDSKFSRRKSGKALNFEEFENVPVNLNLREPSVARLSTDVYSRPPLNTIHEPSQTPSKPEHELGLKSSKIYRTPTKSKLRNPESGIHMKTPEKQGVFSRIGNLITPRSNRTVGRHSLGFSEANSTHSTPTKSVMKPPNPGLIYGGCSRPPVNGGTRGSNFTALSKGIPVNYNTCTTVNTVDVPHFELKEDPSFWMDHNVQVLIRVRPLNGMEISSQGYNRCLKQESAQSLTWVGQPETRFTFDHVACETVDQENLFKMVGLPMVENCLSGYNSCMFAYGQTGSGKTHTMLGEINDLELKPSTYRGMTPRIFEFLFARIIAEEESRKDERLAYNCKCSFLEIYNEQITDLLDPSSTNLQIREDIKTGVYVENLTEYKVNNVGDILKLLSQGSANRRVAATNMNRESSRSHSVFTCVIESRWEKDSTSNLRYARLNLVDLAGSERQKSSGAEGERLKEAANINKSLSTLGHVIMVLVEGANARTRHVPYRDSRLTFLLQDSLGGNSKTMIIANVSPSLSSAIETLNTLKFAQRAKRIQNNAVINEDASGDVTALQHQIRLLKEEIVILKRHNISRSLTFSSKDETSSITSSLDDDKILRVSCKQLKSLETSLNGALRREKSTENSIKQLETEIQQLNCLVGQREEENRLTKMMLKFREDKIQKMESVIGGLIPVDSYLLEENKTLNEEIQILHAKIDKNPEVTRFALENIRLLEQLKRFQDFYEEGEREILLTEVSELRDQLVHLQRDNCINPSIGKLKKSQEELHKCLEKNEELNREIINLNALLEMQKSHSNSDIKVIKEEVVDLQVETEILKTILKEERSIHTETEEKFLFITKEYEKSKSVIEALELQQLVSINELQDLKNNKYDEILLENELKVKSLNKKIINQESRNHFYTSNEEKMEIVRLQEEINEKILKEKETQQQLTKKCQDFDLLTCKLEREMKERILKEKETQQELTILQELNKQLTEKCDEFDLLMNKIEDVLTVGCEALDCASNEFDNGKRKWVSEKIEILARNVTEKELKIEELRACLEDAKLKGGEMEIMLRSLKGATLIMSEANQVDFNKKDEEIERLLLQLKEKNNIIIQLEEQIQVYEVDFMDTKINASQQEVESCCYFDKFVETQHNINKKEADLLIKKKNEAILMEDLFTKEMELLNLSSHLEHEMENIRVLEKFKEEIIISYVDMQLKDLILVEKDEENEKLLVLIKNHKHEIEEFDAENVVKSVVFEGELMGKMALISNLEADVLREREFNALLNSEMKEKELTEKQLKVDLDEKSILIQSLKGDLTNVVCEKDELAIATKQYELELTNAKVNSAQHEVESFCYLDKFLETQHQLNNADFVINKSANENERMKIDIADLINEKNTLKNSYSLEEQHLKTEIDELEHIILQIQATIDGNLTPITSDLVEIKSQIYEKNKLIQKWREEISILHMETVNGLNSENNCVYNDLCESNSKLREENGNLMRDLRNNLDYISKKEEETGMKISSFEKKILEQQVLEGKLIKDLRAKEVEVSIMLAKIEEISSENNRLQEALESEIIFYKKSVEDFQCLVDELESQDVEMKAVGAKQPMQMEELEVLELEKIREQEILVKIQNIMLKSENESQKMKLTEVEDEVNKLSDFQHILAKTKEENDVLKAQNDKISHKLTRQESIVNRVKEELINLREAKGEPPL